MEFIKSDYPAKEAASILSRRLSRYTGQNILLLLSAGSWLSAFDLVEDDCLGAHLTVGMLDDRFSTDSTINNYTQLQQTNFYKRAYAAGVNFIATSVEVGDNLAQANQRWQNKLLNWKDTHPKGMVIVTIGIGVDGHTAGIMPGVDNADFESDSWTAGYEFPVAINLYNQRLTVTNTFLRTVVDEAVVLASGLSKQIYINDLQQETASLSLPFNIIREIPTTFIVTDL